MAWLGHHPSLPHELASYRQIGCAASYKNGGPAHASIPVVQVQKEAVTREFANRRYEQPYQTAVNTSSVIHEANRWHWDQYQEVVGDLTVQQLKVLSLFMSRPALSLVVPRNLISV